MRCWWLLLVSLMTAERCYRRRKTMGAVPDVAPAAMIPAVITPANLPEEKEASVGVDLFVQAQKSLSERSPFDAEDAAASVVPTLPASLVGFFSKHSDSRKRQKKLHSGADAKPSRLERPKSSNIWAATEEFFREVTLNDIERLHDASSFCTLANRKSFLIPSLQNSSGSIAAESVTGSGAEVNVDANGVSSDCVVAVNNEVKDVDRVSNDLSAQEQKCCSASQSCSSLEWLLGSRDKIYLPTERPSKKRKLLGCEAGLEKLLVARPGEGNSTLCHVCSLSDMNDGLNRLIVCGSCKTLVHQKCYGTVDDVDGSWMCSWCKHGKDIGKVSGADCSALKLKPCVLCPRQGGALKPVYKNGGPAEFAHLFCSQWMPEVFIEDIKLMEPIMNVDGIKETRRKLICYLCRAKHGPCVRCSNGTCRTSFHPICAREAGHRMEIWGKLGCDTVELRAFCSKHSDVQDCSIQQLSINKPPLLKVGQRTGDGDVEEVSIMETGVRNDREDASSSDSLNFAQMLKKLIDRGKVDVNDVASEIGVSSDSLATALADDCLAPDLHCKIVEWLRNHAHVGSLQKNIKVKSKSTVPFKADIRSNDGSDAATLSDSDFPDVPVKLVPSRRALLRDNKVLRSSREMSNNNGIIVDEVETGQSNGEDNSNKDSKGISSNNQVVADKVNKDQSSGRDGDNSSKDSFPSAVDKILAESVVFQDSLAVQPPKSEGISYKFGNCGSESSQAGGALRDDKNTLVAPVLENPHCSGPVNPDVSNLINAKTISSSCIHPFIAEKLKQLQAGVVGPQGREFSSTEASSGAGVCCIHQNQHTACMGNYKKTDGLNVEQLVKARDMGVLDLAPEDEVEGGLIYYQHRLLGNAVARKRFNDDLICKVAKRLPAEIDAARSRTWDVVLANQYLCECRELKKQGRKERRYKEAQAVLAAATAAAAASSRISSFRKDMLDEYVYQENPTKLNTIVRSGNCTQLVPRAKETLPRVAVARVSSEKHSDYLQSMPNFSKEHPRCCDICRRSETILNPIIICSGCKVGVHLDCYHSIKDFTGPWYCELCEELLSSKCSRAPVISSREKPCLVTECGLCGGTTGAFKKSTNGQWIHAFCAEWVFESTFRRGQVSLVEGMETVFKDRDVCCICHRKHGVCIKCNYGHCQSTFHPSCARSVGLYMNVRTSGGLLQHKAYCEKHSIEQRAKAETQKHGVEELKSMKQIRVELERLRLLCERIIKREKLKREVIVCSHDILASKRDSVAISSIVHSKFFPPDVSSESATTSLMGHTDSYKSCSEAIQRSDDVTVDSTISSTHHAKPPISMDNDQKTVDSSTSQHLFVRSPICRALSSGKKIPHRPSSIVSKKSSDLGDELQKPRKHMETFQKELVMTSDQASVKNQRLPKGYVYVPIGRLSNEKQVSQDARSDEPSEHDEG